MHEVFKIYKTRSSYGNLSFGFYQKRKKEKDGPKKRSIEMGKIRLCPFEENNLAFCLISQTN